MIVSLAFRRLGRGEWGNRLEGRRAHPAVHMRQGPGIATVRPRESGTARRGWRYDPGVKVILFGATGMVGQGVLRECLLDPGVESVLVVGRSSVGEAHPKLREILRSDLFDVPAYLDELAGQDACFFCLGVSSAGMKEDAYRRLTQDLTLAIAAPLAERSPGLVFVYVSGAGTDSTEQGRWMWARVKGHTENALLALPLSAYMFRPAMIQPLHGVKVRQFRGIYTVLKPFFPLLVRLRKHATTTEAIGLAMLHVARHGAAKRVVENADIADIADVARGAAS
jgi:uncharacterized protein YbjT (DUF2867 family)